MAFHVVLAAESGSVADFEDEMLQKAEQEYRTGKGKDWTALSEMYAVQKRRLQTDPYPEAFNDQSSDDENPPVVKRLWRETTLQELFRWGMKVGAIGNHRILYVIHNDYKVVLLHYFNKQYNGATKRKDIEPAESKYLKFLEQDPSHYPIWKG